MEKKKTAVDEGWRISRCWRLKRRALLMKSEQSKDWRALPLLMKRKLWAVDDGEEEAARRESVFGRRELLPRERCHYWWRGKGSCEAWGRELLIEKEIRFRDLYFVCSVCVCVSVAEIKMKECAITNGPITAGRLEPGGKGYDNICFLMKLLKWSWNRVSIWLHPILMISPDFNLILSIFEFF